MLLGGGTYDILLELDDTMYHASVCYRVDNSWNEVIFKGAATDTMESAYRSLLTETALGVREKM